MPVVKLTLGLPYTVAEFGEAMQLGLRQAVADAASIDVSLVRILSVVQGADRRRRLLADGQGIAVEIAIDVPSSLTGPNSSPLTQAITLDKLNQELKIRGISGAEMLKEPVMVYAGTTAVG